MVCMYVPLHLPFIYKAWLILIFHSGQYRSRLECPDCMKVSKIFDPLMYMSVSLPRKEEKIREIDLIWLDPERRRTRVGYI